MTVARLRNRMKWTSQPLKPQRAEIFKLLDLSTKEEELPK